MKSVWLSYARWTVWRHFTTSPHHLQVFRRTLQCCFALTFGLFISKGKIMSKCFPFWWTPPLSDKRENILKASSRTLSQNTSCVSYWKLLQVWFSFLTTCRQFNNSFSDFAFIALKVNFLHVFPLEPCLSALFSIRDPPNVLILLANQSMCSSFLSQWVRCSSDRRDFQDVLRASPERLHLPPPAPPASGSSGDLKRSAHWSSLEAQFI